MSSTILHVSTQDFQEKVLSAGQPVLVDFWADWCQPCKALAPLLEEVAGEYAGRLTIAKLDVDNNHEITTKYGVRGFPTLLLFKDGDIIASHVGLLSKSALNAFIDSNV